MPESDHHYWIVIPAYNEEKYLSRLLRKTHPFLPNIIVVDDGSRDQTAAVAVTSEAKVVLRHQTNLGKGAALKTGCEYAFQKLNARGVIVMDGDDQHDPAELKHFVEALTADHDIVFGCRNLKEMPTGRVIANRFMSSLVKLLFGLYIPDIPSGYKAFSKKGYQQLRWHVSDYAVELEIAVRVARFKLDYSLVPVRTIYHDFDRGMTILDALKFVGQLVNWRISL